MYYGKKIMNNIKSLQYVKSEPEQHIRPLLVETMFLTRRDYGHEIKYVCMNVLIVSFFYHIQYFKLNFSQTVMSLIYYNAYNEGIPVLF